jgi:hypothetical protein
MIVCMRTIVISRASRTTKELLIRVFESRSTGRNLTSVETEMPLGQPADHVPGIQSFDAVATSSQCL